MAKSVRQYQREAKEMGDLFRKYRSKWVEETQNLDRAKKKVTSIEQGAHQLRNRLNYEMGRADGLAAALATVAVAATRKDGKNG